MVQGGDTINFDGSGGESIYGPTFEDENFCISVCLIFYLCFCGIYLWMFQHLEEGILSMANAGTPHTNSSQFFITTVPCTHLDGINVAFGRVRKGFGVVKEIANVEASNEKPLIVIFYY